jgi:hypothetical protein
MDLSSPDHERRGSRIISQIRERYSDEYFRDLVERQDRYRRETLNLERFGTPGRLSALEWIKFIGVFAALLAISPFMLLASLYREKVGSASKAEGKSLSSKTWG